LLADVADRTTLTGELGEALAVLRRPRARHDPGRVLVDMAVAVADGATTISDVAALAATWLTKDRYSCAFCATGQAFSRIVCVVPT
jgi:hypothetical protein